MLLESLQVRKQRTSFSSMKLWKERRQKLRISFIVRDKHKLGVGERISCLWEFEQLHHSRRWPHQEKGWWTTRSLCITSGFHWSAAKTVQAILQPLDRETAGRKVPSGATCALTLLKLLYGWDHSPFPVHEPIQFTAQAICSIQLFLLLSDHLCNSRLISWRYSYKFIQRSILNSNNPLQRTTPDNRENKEQQMLETQIKAVSVEQMDRQCFGSRPFWQLRTAFLLSFLGCSHPSHIQHLWGTGGIMHGSADQWSEG